MTAWDALKAASSLTVGTAWQLLTHPKGGTGTPGVIISDGYFVEVSSDAVTVGITEMNVEVQVDQQVVTVELQPTGVTVELLPTLIEVEID